ncbi:MAG: MFS transporter, partial [Verrucomicrobiota bacterium]
MSVFPEHEFSYLQNKMLSIQKTNGSPFYVLLSLPATAMGFALCIQISALSWILSTQHHLAIHEVGYVWLAGPLAGILAQPLVGLISDKVWFWGGRRRPFIILGGLLAGTMVLALPFLGAIGKFTGLPVLWVAIGVALSLDLAINVGFNPTRSIIADVTPEGSARAKGFTWMQSISGFFGVLAYVIGAVFGNFALIYCGTALVVLFNVVPALLITEPVKLSAQGADAETPGARKTTPTGRLLHIFFAHGFTWLGIQTMFVFIFAYVKFSMSLADSGDEQTGRIINIAFLVLNVVGFLLPVLVLQPASARIGLVRTHAICIATMAAGYAGILFFGRTPAALYLLMGVVGVGWASTVSLPFAIVSDNVDKSRMGLFMGIFNLSVVIPQLLVSGVAGKFVSAAPDKNIVFVIASISLAVSAALWFLVGEN